MEPTIFDFLNNINRKNYSYLNSSNIRYFNPWIVYQWLCSTEDEYQLMFLSMINDKLTIPKEQLYKLFCLSVNKPQKYKWIYPKKQSNLKYEIIGKYLGCSTKEAKLHDFSNNDIKQMAIELGYQDSELK